MKNLNWLKSKTVVFGLLLTLLGAVQIYLPQFQSMIDPQWFGPITGIVGIIVVVLRAVTTLPLVEK